jgi:GPH family glycoside/pentoside/hexuronide:cation symporter
MADSAVISEQPDPGRLSTVMVLGYSTGNFGFALLGLVVAVNLQYFYTDFVGLSAGLVAWSLLFARLFDSVTDPVMGYLSDRTHTRFGRRRPYIVVRRYLWR